LIASAPASRGSLAGSAGRPAPPAAFSPFRIPRSIRRSFPRAGPSAATACRPGLPTTSPTKRILNSASECVALDDEGVVNRDFRADVIREPVVLGKEALVRPIDVRRCDARRILRLDRLDLHLQRSGSCFLVVDGRLR